MKRPASFIYALSVVAATSSFCSRPAPRHRISRLSVDHAGTVALELTGVVQNCRGLVRALLALRHRWELYAVPERFLACLA